MKKFKKLAAIGLAVLMMSALTFSALAAGNDYGAGGAPQVSSTDGTYGLNGRMYGTDKDANMMDGQNGRMYGTGTCDGTCDGTGDRIRGAACDGTCDGAGILNGTGTGNQGSGYQGSGRGGAMNGTGAGQGLRDGSCQE